MGGPIDLRSNTGLTPHWKTKLMGETGSSSRSPTFRTGLGTAPMIVPRKGNDGGRRSRSRMISLKLRVAGSTGSLRTGTVVRKLTVWPAGVSTGMRDNESGGRKNGVTIGGVSGGNVNGGIRRGGLMPRGAPAGVD